MAERSQGSCLWTRRWPLSSIRPQRALLLCRSIPVIIFMVVLRWLRFWFVCLNHTSSYSPVRRMTTVRQLTLNALQFFTLNTRWCRVGHGSQVTRGICRRDLPREITDGSHGTTSRTSSPCHFRYTRAEP